MPNYLVTVCIAAGCLAAGLIAPRVLKDRPVANASSPASMAYYNSRRDYFTLYNTASADIVAFGDSLVENIQWSELLGCPVINRGIGGDTTANMLARVDQIESLNPKMVIVIAGVNDANRNTPPEQTASNLVHIADRLKSSKIAVSYILPVASWWLGGRANLVIPTTNEAISKRVAGLSNITMIDLRPALADIMDSLTYDGVHWTQKVYARFAAELKHPCRADEQMQK